MPSSRQHSYQLFGVGALAHRGLPPFIGGLCGDYSQHRTTMTQAKCCPIFCIWVMVGSSARKRCSSSCFGCVSQVQFIDGYGRRCDHAVQGFAQVKVPQFLFFVPSEDIPLVSCRRLSLPSCFFSSFSSSVAPLWPLGLGILGRGSVRSLLYLYVVTDAGPASH